MLLWHRLVVGAALIWVAPGFAQGQGDAARGFAASALDPASEQALLVSAQVPVDDLAARVAKLEAALQKAEEKAAAGRPTHQLCGRLFIDFATFSQDAENKAVYGDAKNGIGVRAAWFGVEGRIFDVFSYRTEVGFIGPINTLAPGNAFIGNGVAFKDVWMGVHDLPVLGNLRVGHFKEPYSLEEMISSRFITFMERSMGNSVFSPAYGLGAMVFNGTEDQHLLWQVGVFENDLPDAIPRRDADNFATAFTGRVVWLPWYDECTEGRGLLHLGAAYSYRDAFDAAHDFRSRENSAFGPYILRGGAPVLTDCNLFGLEAAVVYGPFSVQSEYKEAWLEYPTGGNAVIPAFYVQLSYFLTGENRGYKFDLGRFDRVKPFENFFRVRAEDGCCYTGKGAWELAYRYDYCDISEMGAAAGLATTHTVGVNWYLCPYARIMANYVHGLPHKDYTEAGEIDAFMMRYQVDF